MVCCRLHAVHVPYFALKPLYPFRFRPRVSGFFIFFFGVEGPVGLTMFSFDR